MEIKINHIDLEIELQKKYMEGRADGTEEGINLVMKYLESGKDLKKFLIEIEYCCENAEWEKLKGLHWFRIERAIKNKS